MKEVDISREIALKCENEQLQNNFYYIRYTPKL